MTSTRPPRPTPRTGVTLAEVLVSLGIMSVGVITVATLFPLSVLRTIQATQLTHATIVRYNVEATISAFPTLVSDPDRDGNIAEHNGAAGAATPYVVDPLGFARFDEVGAGLFRDNLGGSAATRFGFGVTTVNQADALVTSPDSWSQLLSGVPSSVAGTPTDTATFSEDLSAVTSVAGGGDDRAVFFHDNGRESVVRTILTKTGNTITFDPLPAGFQVGNVHLESQYLRYTWMLTVRNSVGVADVNVAVFFNRGGANEDETLYAATFQPGPRTCQVLVPTASTQPDIKAGGFVLDAEELHWYRVTAIESQQTVGAMTQYSLVLAERPKSTATQVIIYPHIVDVYPIGSFPK